MSPTLIAETTAPIVLPTPQATGPVRRANRRLHYAAGAVAVAGLGVGLAVPTGTSVHTVTGSVQLWQATSAGEFDAACTGRGADADIAGGAPVRIRDANGKLLATAKLGPGRSDGAACVFSFTAADVPRAGGYRVAAGDETRPSAAYTFRAIRSDGWDVRVVIGA